MDEVKTTDEKTPEASADVTPEELPEITTPEKSGELSSREELKVLSKKPFTFEMEGREITLRPIRLEDLDDVLDSFVELFSSIANRESDGKILDIKKGIDPSALLLLGSARKAVSEILGILTDTDSDFISGLSLVDVSILIRAFVEMNQLEFIIENFSAVASRLNELMSKV